MSSHCTHCNLFHNYTIIQKIVTWPGQFNNFLVLYVGGFGSFAIYADNTEFNNYLSNFTW